MGVLNWLINYISTDLHISSSKGCSTPLDKNKTHKNCKNVTIYEFCPTLACTIPEEVRPVRQMDSFLYILFMMWDNVCHHRQACFSAVDSKKTCLLTKKRSIANSTSCWSLIGSLGTLITLWTWTRHFTYHLTVYPFILRTEQPQITLAVLTSSGVTSLPGILAVTISLKSNVVENIIFLNRSFAWTAMAICCLQNNFMLSFTVSTKPNSPIFFGLHTCNPQGRISKSKSCKPNALVHWTT